MGPKFKVSCCRTGEKQGKKTTLYCYGSQALPKNVEEKARNETHQGGQPKARFYAARLRLKKKGRFGTGNAISRMWISAEN